MRDTYIHTFAVPQASIDGNGHVNNLEYLRWMQEVATAHSAAQGWPLARYREMRTSWVIRSHWIEYLRPAFADDALSLATWIAGFGPETSPRRYLFWRSRDRQVVARAETLWVYVGAASGRARRIPEEFRAAFDIVTDDSVVLRRLEAEHGTVPTPAP